MGDFPSGTVTFLFTDVDGSTRLLKQLRERYGDVLAVHRRLLRAVFSEYGGQEIDSQGDAFFVAFGRAKDGVRAAVAAQRALAEHPWSAGEESAFGWHSTGEPRSPRAVTSVSAFIARRESAPQDATAVRSCFREIHRGSLRRGRNPGVTLRIWATAGSRISTERSGSTRSLQMGFGTSSRR